MTLPTASASLRTPEAVLPALINLSRSLRHRLALLCNGRINGRRDQRKKYKPDPSNKTSDLDDFSTTCKREPTPYTDASKWRQCPAVSTSLIIVTRILYRLLRRRNKPNHTIRLSHESQTASPYIKIPFG